MGTPTFSPLVFTRSCASARSNCVVRFVNSSGFITTVAGAGASCGNSGTNGQPGTTWRINNVRGMAVDPNGTGVLLSGEHILVLACCAAWFPRPSSSVCPSADYSNQILYDLSASEALSRTSYPSFSGNPAQINRDGNGGYYVADYSQTVITQVRWLMRCACDRDPAPSPHPKPPP